MNALPCEQAPELWFSETPLGVEFAKAACRAECSLLNVCAELGQNEPHGVWGGTSPSERREAALERRAADENKLNEQISAFLADGMSVRAMSSILGIPRKTLADRINRLELVA
ncbi:WhiB family transcriptional regulator [Streptomyces sp. DH10]|uniref:WhiB family transcriptional regulator n=1 Tax=Streptomyces sp. DH10 TaxID=3040121 RepID=UPI002441BD09|nr:WhiB family transcriptional regulator [Streptomyces sp. DH10]MDG9711122.1 WhiB family transcriptional regulator [Streptomyces sp. DH10]